MIKKVLYALITITSVIISAKEKEFNIAVTSLDLTPNPFYTYTANESQYLSGIYEGLLTYNPQDLSPEPALAEKWSISDDKKTYTFTLRENITFSNGDEITAKTFRDSFLKILKPSTGAEFASLFDIVENAKEYRTGEINDPEKVGIKIKDDKTLIITLKKRAPYFTKILCHHSFTPLHPSYLNEKTWDISNTITSGAYIIKKTESRIILSKREDYWDKKNVYFDKINIIKYTNSDIATKDYNSGKLDWLTDSTINLNIVSDIETLKVNPLFATTYYYFNSNYKEYSDKEVRKAISLLIPWNKIREKQYIPANSLIPTLKNFPKNFIKDEQNIQEALDILKKLGYKDGKGLSEIIISIPLNTYNDRFISNIIKESIEQNTLIKVKIKETAYPDFFTINRTEEFALSTLSWIGDFADPLTFLEMWTDSSNLNDTNYFDQEYNNLIEGSSNLSYEERYKTLSLAEKILLEDYIVKPINHSPGINVIDTRFILNWYSNALDFHPYKFLKMTDKHIIPGLI